MGNLENEKSRFQQIQHWWDVTKSQIKKLTMEVSKILNKNSQRSYIINLEKKLEKLKLNSTTSGEVENKISEIESLIQNYHENKSEASKIRARVKWAEEGEKSSSYFFNLEKQNGKNKL